jgi:hypothetical protein
LGLLLRHAERSAVPAVSTEHPAGFPDASIPEAAIPDPRQSAEVRSERYAWDASGAVRLDATPDAARPVPALADADVEKSADPAPVVLEPDACRSEFPAARSVRPDAEAELCRPDAVPSAGQSCAAQACSKLPLPEAPNSVARKLEVAARPTPSWSAQPELSVLSLPAAEPPDEAA